MEWISDPEVESRLLIPSESDMNNFRALGCFPGGQKRRKMDFAKTARNAENVKTVLTFAEATPKKSDFRRSEELGIW